ncbi:MAG: PKD domain-containing protein, partial [Saprospiraceae bacterium]|nr:PKD domain-containing protein [Saprospiraceae bacterium]
MKQQFLLALFIFLTSLSLNAQEPTFFGQTLHQVSSPTLQEQFHNYQVFQLDVQQLEQYLKYGPEVGRPFQLQIGDAIDWSLELMADDIRSEDYFVSVQQERGLRQKPKGDNITYSGHLLAPEQGRVRLTVHADFLYGRIKTANADWYIEPLDRFHESATPNTYLIYQATDVKHNKKHRCAADDIDQIAEPETANHAALAVGLCYTVDIALAADFDMFSQFGNTVDTENYMLGILNNVQTDYDDAFADELSYEVVTVFIADCPGCDPWTNSNDAGSVLVSFRDWGNTGGFGPVTYDVATLWTNRNFSGSTLGVAWVGGLCTNLRYNTCQDFTSNASLLRVVQSHELGHNFNSQHDNSTGFIMSPSVNNTNTWSNQSINTINSFVSNFAANSGCLTPCVPVGPPVAGLFTPVTNVCPGSLVPFIDQSQNNPSSWDWQFTNGDPSTSNLQHPLVRYNDIGTFPVSLTVENPSGIDFADGTVTVSENGTKYLLYETFENGLLLWSVDNPDNSTSWQVATVSFANYGNKTVFIDNYNYNNAGQNDYLVSPVVDLSLESNVMLEIDYAYVRYSENNSDQMAIEVSTNGGQSYPFVVFSGQENGSGNFATAPDQTFPFSPGSENDWCYGGGFGSDCLSIDLSQFSGNANFRFRIRNTTDFGNNLYVDNIRLSSSCAIDQPPLADFSADVFVGCVPLAVQFLDETVGPVTDRAWTFEGGSPANSSEKDPFVVYDNAGVFDVSLQVGNPAGFSLETKEDFVIALGEPIVAFTTMTNGLEVSFENQTTDGLDYEWEFGDGNTSQEENPVHTYASPGTYTVRLSATNDCGTVVLDQEIVVEASLDASFTQDVSSGCVPFMVQFTDTSIGEIQTWEWTFEQGNPATSTNQNPIVEYQQAGVFDVQLIVSDGNLQDTFYMAALITADTLPTAAFDIDYDLGEPIATFTNEAIAADSLFWDFGDGSTSLAENPQHTYSQDGTYTIQLIAKNDCGSDTTEQELTIVSLPKGSINADTTAGCLPFSVQFDANSSNGATFFWEFEGGTPNTSNEANPSVTYNQAGTFDVYLTVNNAAGTLTDTLTDYITVQDIPTAAFNIDYMLGETSAAFANESIGAESYAWDFGDGNTSTDENPSHDYGMDGTYTVQLIATNACGSDTTE